MASGTADLQRDLGGAVMQSIFGALRLPAMRRRHRGDRRRPGCRRRQQRDPGPADEVILERRGGRAAVPQYAAAITEGAKTSFLAGADWAYLAGIVAVPLGAALVFTRFPGRDEERRLLQQYHDEDPVSRRRTRRSPPKPGPLRPDVVRGSAPAA